MHALPKEHEVSDPSQRKQAGGSPLTHSCNHVKAVAIKEREGVDVKLMKAKSHVGIEGNGEADKLAHEACISQQCNGMYSRRGH